MRRLFPGIDIDAIDGQTVEDAKVLQQAISAYVDELCVRPVHNYKRNTLETLYMFEIQDQEKLLGVLHRVAAWLHEQYHVEAHWGVGTPQPPSTMRTAEQRCRCTAASLAPAMAITSPM